MEGSRPRVYWFLRLSGILLINIMLLNASGGCSILQDSIKIGFVGELTGRNADLGVHARDGALLAIEQINANGGVNGKRIELLIRDDKGTPEDARLADEDLISEGVVAIIGHMTSSQTMAALDISTDAGILMISPTTSTAKLSGLDDNFFRLVPKNEDQAHSLAGFMFNRRKVLRTAILYDRENLAYTETYGKEFEKHYLTLGGTITGTFDFASSAKPDFASIVNEVTETDPQALLIISSAADAALITQQVHLSDHALELYGSNWSMTDNLLLNGGQAIEGMLFVSHYNSSSQTPAFLDFQDRYESRYGRLPTFAATYSFEIVRILEKALQMTKAKAEGLKETILQIQDFDGLNGTLSFDAYGDITRPLYIIIIQNGEYVTLEEIKTEGP